jgi:hypothetical protein
MYIRPRGLFATKPISGATISELLVTARLDIGNTCNIGNIYVSTASDNCRTVNTLILAA